MLHVPLDRAHEILYKNGEIDSRLCDLEVELYQKNAQKPAIYIGYFQSDKTVTEIFELKKEGQARINELRDLQNEDKHPEFVFVDGVKNT